MHQRRAGEAGGHALVHGAGANDNAADDVVVDDRRDGGGQRQRRGDGNVGGDRGLVRAKEAADAVGHENSRDVADGIANAACDGGDAHMQRGGGHVANDGEHAHIDHAGTGEDECVERRTVRVGRLGGGLSLLGGVSVSCRGDPLSSLDAEDLRFFADALSSSCSPEGLPSRSDLSCPHTRDGQQLGAVVAVASARNCGTSGVGGGSEVPAHGLGSLQRCVKQFHSAPRTELASVPEFGLHSLIRSHRGSIRTFGAHAFHMVASEKRPVSSRMTTRLSGDTIRVRVQTFPQFPTIVCDAFYGQPAADPSLQRQELRAQLPSEWERRWSGAEINIKVGDSAEAFRAV